MKHNRNEGRESLEEKLIEKIKELKAQLGSKVIILGHHYQRQGIVALSDLVGDSYFLAKSSHEHKDARYIVFCGVRFMAEAAKILCSENQKVIHPDPDSGCPLADMADLDEVSVAWDEIGEIQKGNKVMPLTYINSSAQLKAFCGRNDGLVCTSSNARRAMEYGFKKASVLFFFPDQHLGRNTAAAMGINDAEIILWKRAEKLGGNSRENIRKAKIILWDGFCHVHTNFSLQDIIAVRKEHPSVKIVVHPECKREVVQASDESGSTSFIVNYVKNAPIGSTIAVGTEINLVSRIAEQNTDKKVVELKRSLCPNMFKITPQKLLYSLENLEKAEDIILDETVMSDARIALARMLEV